MSDVGVKLPLPVERGLQPGQQLIEAVLDWDHLQGYLPGADSSRQAVDSDGCDLGGYCVQGTQAAADYIGADNQGKAGVNARRDE